MNDWLADRARATPDEEALVNASSGNAWDYGTLDETVEEMAGRLAALGVGPDTHLGAVLGTCVEHVCLVHAAMRLGARLVPLSPDFTAPELGDRFDRADVEVAVCDADTEPTVVEAATDQTVVTIGEPGWETVDSLSGVDPVAFEPADWARDDPQLMLFTSGTTGTPKVVVLTMGNLLASALASAFRLGVSPDDRWLVPLSLHHMGGIAPVLRSTLYGTTVVVRETFDAGGTVDDVVAHDVTGVSVVPTMLRRMLEVRGTLPDSLRFVLVGGAPCPAELVERCRDFRVPVCPTYGMTETASQVATARPDEAYDNPESVGRPLMWTRVTVVDEAGTTVEPGETGELVVAGPTVTPGYYDAPGVNENAFGEYGFHTGDVGYRDEGGRIYVLNRLDDRIITGGENVDPGEVVDVLLAHPSIEDAAVVGLQDEQWGERVAALVVPTGDDLSVDSIESFCRERLAGFKIPRTVGFTDELPRTVSGTVEREAVRELLLEETAKAIDEAEEPADEVEALPAGEGEPGEDETANDEQELETGDTSEDQQDGSDDSERDQSGESPGGVDRPKSTPEEPLEAASNGNFEFGAGDSGGDSGGDEPGDGEESTGSEESADAVDETTDGDEGAGDTEKPADADEDSESVADELRDDPSAE